MSFSQNLSYLMKKAQVSNYRLAQDIGVSQSTVANWLNEKSTPGTKKIHEIAEYFNVSVDYLLDTKEPTTNTSTTMPMFIKEYLPIIKHIASLPPNEQIEVKAHFKQYAQMSFDERKEIDGYSDYVRMVYENKKGDKK